MGKRPASSKATRGASKGRRPVSSSSSNPKTNKFRSQLNSLAVIAKGGPAKKTQNKEAVKQLAKDAAQRKIILDGLDNINMLDVEEGGNQAEANGTSKKSDGKKRNKKVNQDNDSIKSGGSKFTTASFASVWSNCSNSSLNEFFQVWNPKLETHKDALAVVAGLSESLYSRGKEQTDLVYAQTLFKILSSSDTPPNVITGALLALTFVIRKLPANLLNDNFDAFYPTLKALMEKYHDTRKKSLIKCLIRCFASLTKAHPLGKEAVDKGLRKMINIAIRQYKVQDKVRL